MRRYTEDVRELERETEVSTVFTHSGVCIHFEGRTTCEGDSYYSASTARDLPLRIARGDVVPVPVTDAKGRRVKR